MNNMLRKLLLLLVICCITGCAGKIFNSKSMFAPKPFRMGGPARDGSTDPDYLSGWDDGCETGMSTMVQGYYKSFYAFKQDPYMVSNPVYYKAWKDSYDYCRHYAFRFAWDSYDRNNSKALDNPLCVLCPNELDRTQ
jgi:hypothetical protein